MRAALHAEWTKLRTVASPLWLLLGGIAATATGVELGPAPIAVLGVLVMAGEYGTGMIRTTLTAMPRRVTALAAKAVVLTGVVAAAGSVEAILIALLGLGIGTIVRDSATSIGVVLGLLYVFPILSQAIGDPHWQRLLQRIGPMSAGLGVTAAWAAAALLAGGLLLHVRDA